MTGKRGVTLIEVIVVMAIVAIALSLAGPRIGAGLNRLELNNAAQTVRAFISLARARAQRTEETQYVILDRGRRLVTLVGDDLQVVRERELPSSVEIVLQQDAATAAFYVMPSGILRGSPVRLRGGSAEVEVALQ